MAQTPDTDLLAAALVGYQEKLKQIQSSMDELRRRLNVGAPAPAAAAPARTRKRRRLSAEGRANIIAALKKRWAAVKSAKETPAPSKRGAKKSARKSAVKRASPKVARKTARRQRRGGRKGTAQNRKNASAQHTPPVDISA
jgi:hypothetical protein